MAAATEGKKASVTLPTDEQVLITREFDAPRHLVYRAWTTPELVRRWWTARRGAMTVAEIDLRVGGRWRYVMTATEGSEVAFHGVYREIVQNESIVSTEVFEAMPDGEALNTITFKDLGDRTLVSILVQHGSREVRDILIKTGMEDGLQEALDLLEQVAVSLRDDS